jgi:predicted pyridoxine 5'-phosphate oxidase superfamily flavin-nucleotide-binding protein
MVKITDEMRAMFDKQVPIVATTSKDGIPNVSPRGSVHVIDDETLAWSESSSSKKTYKNLIENPKIAVVLVDREKTDGYQFKGTAEVKTILSDIHERVIKRQELRGRPKPEKVIAVKVEEIYSIKPGMKEKIS